MLSVSSYRSCLSHRALVALLLALLGLTPSSLAQSSPQATAAPAQAWPSWAWEDWFYGQRMYGLGRIPENALANAVAQRDAMRSAARLGAQSFHESLPDSAVTEGRWFSIGPAGINSFLGDVVSGRVTSVAVDPLNPATVYVAAAGGGVWKSTNRGARWVPLTDNLPSLASGAVAVDPFSGEVWYGTGELNFCRDCYYGAGVYRSSDGGATWTRVNPEGFLSSPTSVIAFDSRNRGTVFIGRSTALWKSSDGGQTWRVVLRGAVTDFLLNPADSSIAYAAIGNFSGSLENGVYRSADGGETWTRLTSAAGLPPQASIGRIALALSPTQPAVVYALIARSTDFNLNGLFRSLDGGETWAALPNLSPDIFLEEGQGQGLFNLFVEVDPRDAAVLYVGGVDLWKSVDFGANWENLSIAARLHEDQRDIVFDPAAPADRQTFYLLGDSGVWRSSDGGRSFVSLNSTLAVTQFQTVGLHPTNPNLAVGGTQDNGTALYRGGWVWEQGRPGDSGAAFYDRANPQTVYTVANRHSLRRSDDGGRTFRLIAEGLDPSDRVLFYPPFLQDPVQPGVLYFATHRLWQSRDRGEHWEPLSGDLTSGGSAVISALVVAPGFSQVLYAGTSDGRVHMSPDGGRNWSPAAPLPDRFVTSIAVDPRSPQRVVAGLSGFGTGHVFRSENRGGTWEDISRNLPDVPVNVVLLDVLSPDTIYVGTDIGVFALTPQGVWTPLKDGMPNAIVLGLAQNPATGLLVAATHGRGAFAIALGSPATNVPRLDFLAHGSSLEPAPLAPGMVAALYGSNLAATTVFGASPPLPVSLAGTTLLVNDLAAPLFSLSPTQVNFQVPYSITGPTAEIRLHTDAGDALVRLARVDASPGIVVSGGEASVLHANFSRVTETAPARRGEELVLFAGGLGAVEPPVASGAAAPSFPVPRTASLPSVRVGGVPAEVRFSGLSPGSVGLYQVNFVVPEGLAGRVPLSVEMGGIASNTVFLSVLP